MLSGFLSAPTSKPLWEPRDYQRRGVELIKQGGTRLFLPPGKGKTTTVLRAFCELKAAGWVDCMLVLAPLRVATTSWPQDIQKWANFAHLDVGLVHGGAKARRQALSANHDVLLMNYEGLLSSEWKPIASSLKANFNPIASEFLKRRRVMLVCDESTRLKETTSSRYKTLKKYLPFFERVVIMTGSPQPSKLEDVFAQCYLTDLGRDLGPFVTHFRARYMQRVVDYQVSKFGRWEPQVTGPQRLAEAIKDSTLQLEADEVLPVDTVDIWLPMPESAKRHYEELRKQFLTLVEGQVVMAPSAGVLLQKLLQCAQGAVWTVEGRDYRELHTAKLDALESILEELNGTPLFALYAFKHDYERINKRLKREIPRIGGGISVEKGAAHCQLFGAGYLPLLLAHPQSAAHGIDGLQNHCRDLLWFGQSWSWELTHQAHCRIVRQGSKADSVTIRRLLVDCQVERAVHEAVTTKQLSEEALLTCIRNELEKG